MNSVTLVFLHLLLASAFRMNSAEECMGLGCSNDVSNPNSDDIKNIMSSALSQVNAGYKITNIQNCKTQLVSGVKYDCQVQIKSESGETATCNLVVVQKPWMKTGKQQIISENCSSASRNKRSVMPGAPSSIDANSDNMKGKLNGILSQTNSGLSLVKGTKCTSQVVAGIKYDCTIQVESPKTNGVQTCRLVFVEQPWISPDPNVVEDTCSQLVRNKREIMTGAPKEIDANSEDMKGKINGVLTQSNSGLTLVKGTKCTTQVVAGIKYDCTIQVESPKTNGVQTCHLVFVEQAWISPDPNVVEDTCSQLVRNKREIMTGAPKEIDANSDSMKGKLNGVLTQSNSGLTLVKGSKCTSQVVAGIKYDCTIQVESPKTNGVQTCHLVFVEQPWISPDPNVVEDTCSQLVRNKREVCAGCPIKQNPDDEKMKKTISDTLKQTNAGLGLVGVDECTSQVVAGVLYKCSIRVDSAHFNGVQTCQLEFLSQPWVTKEPQLVKDTCSKLVPAKRS